MAIILAGTVAKIDSGGTGHVRLHIETADGAIAVHGAVILEGVLDHPTAEMPEHFTAVSAEDAASLTDADLRRHLHARPGEHVGPARRVTLREHQRAGGVAPDAAFAALVDGLKAGDRIRITVERG